MATLFTVLSALEQQITAATQGLVSSSPDTPGAPLTVEVGLYWPSAKSLQNNVRKGNGPGGLGPSALVTIYDRGIAADSTRWLPSTVSTTGPPTQMTVVATAGLLSPLGSLTITFGGTIVAGDAVGIVLSPALGNSQAVVPIAIAGDTPSTMATRLAQMLALGGPIPSWAAAADVSLPLWVSAVAVGPVVTLTSLTQTQVLALQVNVGNPAVSTRLREIGRRKRHLQIVVWCRTVDDRITVGDPIEVAIAEMESDFGLTFPDGTVGRLTFSGDTMHDEATLSDVLRRDFMVCAEYGVTTTDQVYAVLAPIVQTTTF